MAPRDRWQRFTSPDWVFGGGGFFCMIASAGRLNFDLMGSKMRDRFKDDATMPFSGQKMQLSPGAFPALAQHSMLERKRRGLPRAQAEAACNASISFIRDAESDPARCSLGRLAPHMTGLGLQVTVEGWGRPSSNPAQPCQ